MTKRRYRTLRRMRVLLIAGTWLAGLLVGAALATMATLAYTPDPIGALLTPQAPPAAASETAELVHQADAT